MMKFKKIIVLMIAIAAVLSLVSCANKSETPKGMKNAAREDDPFYLYVPESWVTNKGDIVGAYYSNTDKSNITVMPYGGDFSTSAEYWEDFKKRCADEFSEFEVVKENAPKVVSGRNALQFVYKLKIDGVVYQCQQTVLAYGNLLYVITYTAKTDKYESHLAEIDNILSLLAFK